MTLTRETVARQQVAEACRNILGTDTADAIIKNQSLAWAVVAAMERATTEHDPASIECIRGWVKAQREASS